MSTIESQVAAPFGGQAAPGEGDEASGDGAATYQGDLLTLPPDQAMRKAMRLFKAQDTLMRPVLEQVKLNEWSRRGIVGGRLIRDPKTGTWRARPPTRVTVSAEFINKADTLCRKMTGILTADPPAPEAEPGEGDGDDPAAAEFATRALLKLEMDLRRIEKLTQAIGLSHTSKTVFERFYYNPTGGGKEPIEIEAGYEPLMVEAEGGPVEDGILDQATSLDDAEFKQEEDPMTGEMRPGEPWPMRRKRFLKDGGEGLLTDEKAEAATRWVGRIESELIRVNNVRLYPHTATSVEDAHGVGILLFVPWGKLRKASPFKAILQNLDNTQRESVFNWRTDDIDNLLPAGMDEQAVNKSRQDTENRDEWLVPVLTTYFDGRQCPGDYPAGCYMVQIGESILLHRSPWEYQDADGTKQPMRLPLAQLTLFREGVFGAVTWPGNALMEIVGPGNEVRAAQIGSMLDYLDRLNGVKTFVPSTSVLDARELNDRTKRYLVFNSDGGTPVVEDLPPYPDAAGEMFQLMSAELDDASGLQQAGQGLQTGDVKSGVQALTVISQVQAALSPQARAVVDYYLAGCEIELEMVRAYYTQPRQIRWVGEDGRYKQQAWSRSELGSVTDVGLAAGTMTMLRPAQKALLAREYFQMGVVPPEDFQDTVAKHLGGDLALQDDPFRQRVRRQIEDWKQGPPPGWQPIPAMEPVQQPLFAPGPGGQMMPVPDPTNPMQPVMQPVLDPVTQQPQMQPAVNPETGEPLWAADPASAQLWRPSPSDTLPAPAALRLRELAKLSASVRYEQAHPAWQAGVDREMARMQQALAPPPMMMPGASGEEGGPGGGNGGGPGSPPDPTKSVVGQEAGAGAPKAQPIGMATAM